MEELTYEQTIELEENIKLKNQADKIYADFVKHVKLDMGRYKNGRFTIWADSHNVIYIKLNGETFTFICEFLHENYQVDITPAGIFRALKNKSRGVDHLESMSRNPQD